MYMLQYKKICQYLGDSIFPPRAEELLVRALRPNTIHELAAYTQVAEVSVLATYTDPHIRALIHEAKFQYNPRAHKLLAHLLTPWVQQHAIYLPIPLSARRRRERGYNQVEEVLRHAPNCMYQTNVLYRQRHTAPQTSLDRTARITNVHDAFAVDTSSLRHVPAHVPLIIVDDVLTTGATLRAAAAALRAAAPHHQISCLALAH